MMQPLIWQRRGLVRPGFERSACTEDTGQARNRAQRPSPQHSGGYSIF